MDERELKDLFQDASGEPPPARFTAADVATASRRATARARRMVAGTAAAVVVLAGAGTALGVVLTAESGGAGTVAASAPNEEKAQPMEDSPARTPGAAGADAPDAADTAPRQGAEAQAEEGPRAGSAAGCGQVDPTLAAALADEFPVAERDVRPGPPCPADVRVARADVSGGTVTVMVVSPGTTIQLPEQPEGTLIEERATGSGGTLYLLSEPEAGGQPPFAGDLANIAGTFAARF